MRFLGGFFIGIACSKWILAHVALQVIAWHPFACRVMLK